MDNWQVTATTIFCDAVEDEVTIMVNKGGGARCTGYNKYGQPNADTTAEMKKKAASLGKELACEGPVCSRVKAYSEHIRSNQGCGGAHRHGGGSCGH
jgi:hypothetical protein